MHIVFATVEFVTEKTGDGGLANYLDKASKIFAEKGHKVTIIVLSEKDETFEYGQNISVIRVMRDDSKISPFLHIVSNMELKKILRDCCYSFRLNQILKKLHKENPIDIVQYCHLNALGLFRRKNIPSIIRMSAFNPIDRETYKCNFDLKKCKPVVTVSDKIDFLAIQRADGVFAPSGVTAKALKKAIHRDCETLETPTMGINISTLQELPEELKGKKYFLFFGTLNNKKGLKVIVQSIYRILKENPEFYFVMVGKDCGVSISEGMRTSAVKKIKEESREYQDRILYFSALFDRNFLNTIIYHAQICILPYRFDNLPNTCVEALELGRIVVSTYKSGISQLIKNGYNGFLIEQDDPDALADKVREIVHMSDEDKKMISVHAVQRAKQMNPENFYTYMIQYYQKIIAQFIDKCGWENES